MKKLFYLLLLLPFAFGVSSCNDDDDLPNVNITMNFSNVVAEDGVLYVAETDTIYFDSIETKAIDSNQSATLTNILYFWNYVPAPSLTWGAFPLAIPVAKMPLSESGNNVLGMDATLLETDKSISYANFRIPVKVVATQADLPNGAIPGKAQLVLQVGPSSSK